MGTGKLAAAEVTTPLKVLYIEDNLPDATLALRHLRREGISAEADVVSTRREFTEKLHSNAYDVILADYRLPDWSGMEALDILRQENRDIPFILVTGALGDDAAVDCIKKGAADYILKDRPATLAFAVRRALDERALRDQRKRDERARAYLASIVDSSQDAIIGESLTGIIQSWNRGAESLYGYTAAETVGRPITMLAPPEGHEEIRSWLALIKRGERLGPTEAVRLRKEGKRIIVSMTISPVIDPAGHVVSAAAIAHDVTQHKFAEEALARQAEALSQSNAELEQFAYVASHDLQEPLRTIASFAQLLQKRYRSKLDANADEFIEFIVNGAARMQGLINDLLIYSRVGRKGKEPAATDCSAVLDGAIRNLQMAIAESGAQITYDALPTIKCDGAQIMQLFQNLLGNSIKFRGGQRPRIHVGVERRLPEWVFSVKDNGIGIDPQFSGRVFEIFQRLHTRDEYPGSGIGLAIAKKIVTRHGGRIWFESQPHHGATFFFTLPA